MKHGPDVFQEEVLGGWFCCGHSPPAHPPRLRARRQRGCLTGAEAFALRGKKHAPVTRVSESLQSVGAEEPLHSSMESSSWVIKVSRYSQAITYLFYSKT